MGFKKKKKKINLKRQNFIIFAFAMLYNSRIRKRDFNMEELQKVVKFKGADIFKKEFMIKLINLYGVKEVVLKTVNNTLQIKLYIEDFLNPNHAICQVLAAYPDVDLLLSEEKIIEEFLDINDPFVNSYLKFANNWEDNLKVPLPLIEDITILKMNLKLKKINI